MIRLFKKLHLWLSVPFGIIIALICFSGAMLVFESEITRCAQKDRYYVKDADGEPLPMAQLMESVKRTLPDSVTITGVTVYSDKDRTYQVNLSKPRRAAIFVDQYTGKITGKTERLGFFSTMFKLHRWLLDSANPHGAGVKVGKLLVGISTIIFVLALITGIVLWWPRARANFKKSLGISCKGGWGKFWRGLHVAGGMWALLLCLAMALTGLTWSFGWYRSAFYAVCGVKQEPRTEQAETPKGRSEHHSDRKEESGESHRSEKSHKEEMGDKSYKSDNSDNSDKSQGHDSERRGIREGRGNRGGHSEFGRWQEVYTRLRVANPEAPQITVGPKSASVTLSEYGNGRAADKYKFDNRTGEITLSSSYADSKPADKLRGWIFAMHTGALGGIATRILWFLAALLGASLPLTGYYIWIKRLCRK